MQVTALGRFLRKVRIDKDQILKDMAEKLGVSVAQLSAIELGKRSVSADFVDNFMNIYADTVISRDDFQCLVDVSQPVHKEDFKNASDKHRELFVTFARKYKELPESEANDWLEKIKKM
ncbi:helix-turn-helix domain-containing protein [Salmonella enterica]|uniref:helix-turn-helix domain-containing protein n=1 Tax=Salmonella enterica TaxID=28901 RepID=UPI0009AD0DF4|nr:helix-turn-helix transcriptional regulator [Salmonella enterica]EBV6971413.1 transcriptional regulator [Salmonella enterica subsp. enterica serovar Gaminara]ECC9025384.1 transcriptional regulator [Salmonella enterica subsp. enterica]ECO0313747.1 transcriptional regulator [Salmonella enterica subsp. enterica serovar Schwarzengrund]ECV7796386.1 transcriptional regulator [Salmonella enterica subsp. enterica serovar Brandenburg]EDE9838956.1 helix-turn-helix domain-containing protein [Salmonella